MEIFSFSVLLSVTGSHSRMAKVEPMTEAVEKLDTISLVVEWAGVSEALAQAFYGVVGATGQEHPRTLGVVSCDEVNEGMKELQVNDKPLTIVQKGLIRSVHRVCCLMAGTAAPAEETEALKDQLDEVVITVGSLTHDGPPETPSNKLALGSPQGHPKQVISQASEEAAPLISQSDLLKHWDCLKKIFGRHPKPDEECTGDQLTESMYCCSAKEVASVGYTTGGKAEGLGT